MPRAIDGVAWRKLPWMCVRCRRRIDPRSRSKTTRALRPGPSFRSVCSRDMDGPIAASTRHVDAPGIAADLAILNEASCDVWFDVDLDLLSAKGTGDEKIVGLHLHKSIGSIGRRE